MMPLRQAVLGGLALLTFAAVFWVDARESALEQDVVAARQPERPVAKALAQTRSQPDSHAIQLGRAPAGKVNAEPFREFSWYVAPPAPPKVIEKPAAPPLPFLYLGKMADNGQYTVFVERGGRNYGLRQGDLIDGVYRVEAIASGTLTMMYLPLNEKQSMAIGEME